MKKEMSKVAFFMSCYNHEKFVGEAIDSIMNQTYPHWELFIANDGSTDNSGDIIASYKDERIHYYDLKENTKFAGAIEMIYEEIRERNFDFVNSMASDDKIDHRKLEKQIAFLEEHPQYAACFTWDKVIFEEDCEGYPEEYSHVTNRTRFAWMDFFYEYGNCMNANSALIRKDVFYEMDTMNERYIVLGDYRLWYMIAAKYPIYVIPEELTFYRRHKGNLSNMSWEIATRSSIEFSRIVRDIVTGMDEYNFVRAYYPQINYRVFNNHEEFLAEKFIMLANGNTVSRRHAAIEFYFDHCSNRGFVKALKERYDFENGEFTFLKDYSGLPNALNEIAMENGYKPFTPQMLPHTFRPWKVLLKAIERGQLTEAFLREANWNAVWWLATMRESNDNIKELFVNVKVVLQKTRELIRGTRERRKVLFIVACESDWRLHSSNTPFPPDDKTDYYIAYVNKMDVSESVDIQSIMDEDYDTDITDIQYVDLFDKDEQCLLFADRVIDGLTDICYVDSLHPEYECYDMIKGYPLFCSQTAIMEKRIYDAMMEVDKNTIQIVDDVFYYE